MSTGPTWLPKPEDYETVLRAQNPWWSSGVVPVALKQQVARPLAEVLWHELLCPRLRRFQIVVGPRRVGKTTAMYQSVQRLIDQGIEPARLFWMRLDHPLLVRVPLDQLMREVTRRGSATPDKPAFVFLDELTYSRDWDRWLKTFYDEKWPVRIVGTSSSALALKDGGAESGFGRWDERYLAPYLFDEYLALARVPSSFVVRPSLADTLCAGQTLPARQDELERHRRRLGLIGGFPELLLASSLERASEEDLLRETQPRLRSDAIERAVYKDIPRAVEVRSPDVLERLLYVLGAHVGGAMSPQGLCEEVSDLKQPTFDRYLTSLERSYLVFTLQNFAPSDLARQRRGRKLYFVDGAVRNAALHRGHALLTDPEEMGILIENQAAAHLRALSMQTSVRTYFWREKKNKAEVDLVYDDPNGPLAFEVSGSAHHHRNGLIAFAEAFPKFRGGCYLVAPGLLTTPATQESPGRLSLELFLLLVSAQADASLRQSFGSPARAVP